MTGLNEINIEINDESKKKNYIFFKNINLVIFIIIILDFSSPCKESKGNMGKSHCFEWKE